MADTQNIQINDYFQLTISEQKFWLPKIGESDWRAGKYLFQLLSDGQFKKHCGEKSTLFLLTQGDKLISFCSFTERDEIPETENYSLDWLCLHLPCLPGKTPHWQID